MEWVAHAGRAFPGDPDSYPGRDDVVAYLTDYASDFDLPDELDSRVRSIRKADDGYLVDLDDRACETDHLRRPQAWATARARGGSPRRSCSASAPCSRAIIAAFLVLGRRVCQRHQWSALFRRERRRLE